MPQKDRVLLVDDDPDISLALSDYLSQEGYNVEVVSTGTAALEKGVSNHYDVALLDVGLPDLHGIDVLMQLVQCKPQLPIILLTAFTTLQNTIDSEKIDKAFACLTKPYSREHLKVTIHQAIISQKHQREEELNRQSVSDLVPTFPSLMSSCLSQQHARNSLPNQIQLEDYEQLKENVGLMQFAFDHVSEAIVIADADRRIRFANQAASQDLGYTKKELETLRIPDIVPTRTNQHYQEHLANLRRGKTLSYRITHRTKDGRDIPSQISVYRMNVHGQEFTCAITKSVEAASKDKFESDI